MAVISVGRILVYTDPPMSTELIAQPEVVQLREQVLALTREVASLLVEGEELSQVVGPALLLNYQLQLGASELRALQAEAACSGARRAVELARAELACGRNPSQLAISAVLEQERLAWDAKVEQAAGKLEQAQSWAASPTLTDREFAELKQLFGSLVACLHPELAGTSSPQQLWLRVQQSYLARDLESLRELHAVVSGEGADGAEAVLAGSGAVLAGSGAVLAGSGAVLAQLGQERDRLQLRVTELGAELARLRCSPPLELGPLLEDASWVQARSREAEERIAALNQAREQLQLELRALLKADAGQGLGASSSS
jgi:hypothetical protein